MPWRYQLNIVCLSLSLSLHFSSFGWFCPCTMTRHKVYPSRIRNWLTSLEFSNFPEDFRSPGGVASFRLHVLTSHCYLFFPFPFLALLSFYLSLWSNQHILSPFTQNGTLNTTNFPGEKVMELESVTSGKQGLGFNLPWIPPPPIPRRPWGKELFLYIIPGN